MKDLVRACRAMIWAMAEMSATLEKALEAVEEDLSDYEGHEGQDRESYTDDQDRENYTEEP